ncbi:discoidin domain-containing protein [Sphingomonas qilianensis]|uniref:Discoidin domain-containing protein n=1 Tax=Sphingomonas qilianensis TaxID=1736690 RepID=A0ABU9XTS0_9SPHN
MLALALALAAQWAGSASDGVTAQVVVRDDSIRLGYDFAAVSGYAVARRTLARDWPANFVLRLQVRGSGGVNDLQIKFSDATGKNVWWAQRRNFRPSAEWQTIEIRPRDISFAWGPTTDKTLRRTATMEIVLVRGRDGGAGQIEFAEPVFTALPPPMPLPAPRASDGRALEARRTLTRPLTIDFGGARDLGGLMLRWGQRFASRYTIDASDDGRRWRTLRTVAAGDGGTDPIALPDLATRYVRLTAAGRPELGGIELMPSAWGATPNAMITALAKAAPRGSYPRGFSEQSYWTLVASDGGAASGLIGEDGAIEVAKGGFSIEPFVSVDGSSFSWADVTPTQSLRDGYLPMPGVEWRGDGWTLRTTLAAGPASPRLLARWRLTNTSARPRMVRLALGVRPFQVNPVAQFLSQQGGVSPISRIAWDDTRLAVTTPPEIAGDPAITRALFPVITPMHVAARPFDQGALVPASSGARSVDDPTLLASATLDWSARLAPGETLDVPMVIGGTAPLARAAFDAAEQQAAAYWRRTLGTVTITAPPPKQAVADTLKTALAHILMSRDGPALKPGTRSYDRSWIRDGAMMGDTLLRLGQPAPVRAFADWYGTKLFANGKVPCCVDARGPDPVPENDSQGEYIHLVTQLYRFTGDRAALARDWPRLDAARRYMEAQRQSERSAANLTPERRHLYGLLPASISHEAYSAEAQYSLWDDFWGLTGYKDAVFAAGVLSRPERAQITGQRDQFAANIHAAIMASTKRFGIDFIPGAASLGDFDATSTTIALDPAGEGARLDRTLLSNTFAKQYARVMARAAPGATWPDYTPYELRNVSALVRLGQRDRANDLLTAYMADRRPTAWNGWAEVIGRDPREIRFIGDMPHAWVASDFIRAALDLFAYVRGDDAAIVLGGGLDAGWLAGSGAAIRGLRTPYGTIDLAARNDAGTLRVDLTGSARPPGGFLIAWPFAGAPGTATIDGTRQRVTGRQLQVPVGARRIVWQPAR